MPFSSQYFLREEFDERRNVFFPLAQRRKLNVDDVQAVVQILAESAFVHEPFQIDVRCSNDPRIDLDRIDAAKPHEFLFLNHTQQLGLRFDADRSDFIEEDRSLIGNLEQSLLCRDRAGKRASHVSEQRAFEQIDRHAAAIDRNECFVDALALEVNRFRDQLLACAAFALNQDRAAARRDLRYQIEHLENFFALADDVVVAETFLQRATQLKVFAHQLALFDGVANDDEQLFVVPGLGDVIEGSFFDGGDCSFHRSDRGDDDDGQGRIDPFDVLLDFHAGFARQHQIQQYDVVKVLFDLSSDLLRRLPRCPWSDLRSQQQFDAFSEFPPHRR